MTLGPQLHMFNFFSEGGSSCLRHRTNSITLFLLSRCLPPSPANSCSSCGSISCEGRIIHDGPKGLGEICCGGDAEFVLGRLQGHKNFARERTIEGPGGGTSERERSIGKQSRNCDGRARCISERE